MRSFQIPEDVVHGGDLVAIELAEAGFAKCEGLPLPVSVEVVLPDSGLSSLHHVGKNRKEAARCRLMLQRGILSIRDRPPVTTCVVQRVAAEGQWLSRNSGAGDEIRTRDLRITSALL
ncbi:MAG: hypothetical protein QME77_13195, partial [bacterium]|nr:hypothetical protein [bacterium]